MTFLGDVGQLLQDNALGTLGTDLQLGEQPDTPDAVVTLGESAGLQFSALGYTRSPNLQVRTRSSKAEGYAVARAKIESIFALLSLIGDEINGGDNANGVTINGTKYLKFGAIQEPFPLGKDEKGRHQIAQNYIVTYYRS